MLVARQLLRAFLLLFGTYLIVSAIGGMRLMQLGTQYPFVEELQTLPSEQTIVINLAVGVVMLFIALSWWYKEFKKK